MQITLSPMRRDDVLTLHRAGDILTINGEAFDFSPLPEGATLPREAVDCDWLASDVTRTGGALHLTLILPHGAEAPPETLFPAPVIDPANGPVELPPHSLPPETAPEEVPDAD
ncbi:MAG: hypothetical protein ACK4GC_15875 [Paracoccaceae bacterium]